MPLLLAPQLLASPAIVDPRETLAVNASFLMAAQWSASEGEQLARIRRSVATVAYGGNVFGSAVLVGADGTFLAHRSVASHVGPDGVIAQMSDGARVRLFLVARDTATQYALLQARPWIPGPKPAQVIQGDLPPGRVLAAVTGTRVFRAEVAQQERIGVDTATRRMVPLTELRFEAGTPDVGGASLFTLQGEFVGCVTATLRQEPQTLNAASGLNRMRTGPGSLVVGYATAPDVTRRAVEGFLSPARRPQVAAIGILCRDATGGGALVEQVETGSPANQAGMLINDVILQIGDRAIEDQIAFAKVLYTLKPGAAIPFRIRRAGKVELLSITPGLAN